MRRRLVARRLLDERLDAALVVQRDDAVAGGVVADVRELGAVVTGAAPGRSGPEAVTLFDSTGLAIQDLALCLDLLSDARAASSSVRL